MENRENKKDPNIENDAGWTSEPVVLARQSLWESNDKRVRFLRTLPGQILIALWLYCVLRGLLSWMVIDRGILRPLVNNGTIAADHLTAIQAYSMIFVLAGFILYMWFAERRSFPAMGFIRKNWLLRYLAGLCCGFVMFLIVLLISAALTGGNIVFSGSITPGMFLFALGGFMIQGMAEEAEVRGYMFLSISRTHKEYIGVICSSLFFGVMHLLNSGVTVLSVVNTTLFGFAFCLMFIVSENIWFIAAFHTAWNFAQGNIFGMSVSGHESAPGLFTVELPEGSEILTGGSYGIEAGVITTAAALVLIAISLVIIRKRRNTASN
jgi:hypothetical protein